MGLENPGQLPDPDISRDELLGIVALSSVAGGALWWLGHSGPEITAAVISTLMMARGATMQTPLDGRPTTEQMRATGRHMLAFGFGSAAIYFGISDSLGGYLLGGTGAFVIAAAPENLKTLFRR